MPDKIALKTLDRRDCQYPTPKEVTLSTPAIIHIQDEDGLLLCSLQKHCDGSPAQLGAMLQRFFRYGGAFVDGIDRSMARGFNGMWDAATQLIAYLKLGGSFTGTVRVGDLYIFPPGYFMPDHFEANYVYDISPIMRSAGDNTSIEGVRLVLHAIPIGAEPCHTVYAGPIDAADMAALDRK